MSAKSSLISMNWPELTLSTSLRGNGWAADDRVRPAVAAGWGSRVLAGKVLVRVLVPDCCWEVVISAPVWVAAVSDTAVRRCGGGRVPKDAGGVRVSSRTCDEAGPVLPQQKPQTCDVVSSCNL